jgi:hypothetical protein
MIRLKPRIETQDKCQCGGEYTFSEFIWQGLHVCESLVCGSCGISELRSLPVNQSYLEKYSYFPQSGLIKNSDNQIVKENWYSSKLKSVSSPIDDPVDIKIEILRKHEEVIILNTLDYVYGHSLLYLLNLDRLISNSNSPGIIVIVQPMLKWLIPKDGIAEIWTVNLKFNDFNYFYPDLSLKINNQFSRFKRIFLSKGHVIPTNRNIGIEKFTGIKPYDFSDSPEKPGITFIWREDPGRLWIRNIYLSKGFKKIGIGRVLLPVNYLRVLILLRKLKKELGDNFVYTVGGLGKYGKFPDYIDDQRVTSFDEESERKLCKLYSESIIVVGVHGSSMILPSAHAGMTVSMMPSKRWGNFAEDLLFSENDIRLAFFQKRIIPLNMSIFGIKDIITDMIRGRDYFIKKFLHTDDL